MSNIENLSWEILEINIPGNFTWITSYQEFVKNNLNKQWELNWKYSKLDSFLYELKKYINSIYSNSKNIDPIAYIYEQYWNKGIGTDEILIDIISKIWKEFSYSYEWFRTVLRNAFEWEIREKNERTEYSKQKREKSKNMEWVIKFQNKQTEDTIASYNKSLLNIISINNYENSKRNFSKEKYEELTQKSSKIIYILSICFNQSQENTVNTIKQLASQINIHTIEKCLNLEIQNLLKENQIELVINNYNITHIITKFSLKNIKK